MLERPTQHDCLEYIHKNGSDIENVLVAFSNRADQKTDLEKYGIAPKIKPVHGDSSGLETLILYASL